MVQPVVRIRSAQEALDAARELESPVEVQQFEAMAAESAAVRAFLETEEWSVIRHRIMGDGRPPTGRANSYLDVARRLRWTADGAYSPDRILSAEARDAFLQAAGEVEAFGRIADRAPAAAVEPAPDAFVPPRPSMRASRLSFGEAMLAVRAGEHISRKGWSHGSYVTAQAGYPQGIGVNANTAAATGLPEGTVVVFSPYLMRVTFPQVPVVDDGKFVEQPPSCGHWVPDHVDMFADDWYVLPRSRG